MTKIGILASVPLSSVLREWNGLGYNRRAKFLNDAAKIIAKNGFPRTVADMEKLPGVGYYTARAIAAFAFNAPEVFVETNIRTVLFYHCMSRRRLDMVSDAELLPLVAEVLARSKMPPREFYAAFMDYGAHLKKQGVRLNARSAHYATQSPFKGSRRQKRAALLRKLLACGASDAKLEKVLHS